MTLTRDLDSTTAALDPLGADAVMRALPQANIAADTAWLRSQGRFNTCWHVADAEFGRERSMDFRHIGPLVLVVLPWSSLIRKRSPGRARGSRGLGESHRTTLRQQPANHLRHHGPPAALTHAPPHQVTRPRRTPALTLRRLVSDGHGRIGVGLHHDLEGCRMMTINEQSRTWQGEAAPPSGRGRGNVPAS